MSKIVLKDYQKEAVKYALKNERVLFCMRVGSGKTFSSLFSLRMFFKNKWIDKSIIACTKSSTLAFKEDLKEKLGYNVDLIEEPERLFTFLRSNDKVCLVKHSMLKEIGSDFNYIRELSSMCLEGNLRLGLIVDEAHKLQNTEGVTHEAFNRIRVLFSRIILMTATPYSSCLSQFYGLIHLIYPDLWKSKREFFNKYIDEVLIRDPRTFRVVRKEKVRYRNLKDFREHVVPFTYFYYPPIPLEHVEFRTKLPQDKMLEYEELCKGILRDEDKEKIEKTKKG